jgi:nucleoside 2-deoxyribosyltransferase
MPRDDLQTQPEYCQYSDGPCDQDFAGLGQTRAVILYPSDPEEIASTVENAVAALRRRNATVHWRSWRQMKTTGQVIFCEICKNMRFTDCIVADVTTLNLNLLFEVGFALGLEMPVIPIRDTTFRRDYSDFEQLGMLDTIGYLDFQNGDGLASALLERLPVEPIPTPPAVINKQAPLYVLKGPIDTDGAVRMMSVLKKSPLRFRTYDPFETPRLSLHDARKQVAASIGICANLLHPERQGATVHNARVALIAGMAMASSKVVLLLQEGIHPQPIDYRDVVRTYRNADQVESLLEKLIRPVLVRMQDSEIRTRRTPKGLLESLDLGDVAAENEIVALNTYFVQTAQYAEALRGYARLVVGRKGSGKTAIFYAIRDSFRKRRSHLILDLKPEGHQFTKLREVVLSKLTPGLQEHTMVAFWNYILLCELAQKIRDHEYSYAERDARRKVRYDALMSVYQRLVPATEPGDFSERLLRQVDRLSARFDKAKTPTANNEITETLFRGEIRDLGDVLADYLEEKEHVWVLVDNLDKSWPTRGASTEDILILRALLEATRKIQRQLEQRDVICHALVFLRNDIYEHLVHDTSDKGKDTAIVVDWPDPDVLKELVARRVRANTELTGSFDDLWPQLATPNVGVQDSFGYVVSHTLMRPRDLLNFLHRAVEVAVNRRHAKIQEDDFRTAQRLYSEDLLLATAFELKDVFQGVPDPLYVFLGCPTYMSTTEVEARLQQAGIGQLLMPRAVTLLVWFGFLGVRDFARDEFQFSYEVRYNVDKLLASVRLGKSDFVVHPAFRDALECVQVGLT